jgi:hypothetical protein
LKVIVVPSYYRIPGAVALVVMLLALAACDGPPPKPAAFNDRIARNNEKWNTAVLAFKKALEPAPGTIASGPQANAAYDELEKTFKVVKQASYHMPAPSSTGRELLLKYQAYLDVEEEILHNEVKKMVTTAGDANLSAANKSGALNALYVELGAHEKKAWDELIRAQSEFTKAHNLQPQANTEK